MERHNEENRTVVITSDDMKNIEEFFNHFKIDMPENISKLIAHYRKDPGNFTFENQKYLRACLALALNTIDHPLIKDDVFNNIRAKCDKAYFDAQFDSDITTLLSGHDL